jgi:hypothetical protein
MPTNHSVEQVGFLTVESGTDLIVSFAIDGDEPGEVLSLTLLRTPKYEVLLAPEERGVRVSHERYPDHDEDYLRRIRLTGGLVEVETSGTRYWLDVSRVDPAFAAGCSSAPRSCVGASARRRGRAAPTVVLCRASRLVRRSAFAASARAARAAERRTP